MGKMAFEGMGKGWPSVLERIDGVLAAEFRFHAQLLGM